MGVIPSGFEKYNQFILWRPIPQNNGKVTKKPSSIHGYDIDPHDCGYWMSAEEVLKASTDTGYGIGFVFTEDDPYFFIDIDGCLLPSGWSQRATELCQWFGGAYVEISQSGRGLHIFGSGHVLPSSQRRCKSVDDTFDLYNTGRFVALVGDGAMGSVDQDCTQAIHYITETFLKKEPGDIQLTAWTAGPVEGYTGPVDDDLLIRMMLNSKSSSVFDGRASVKQLWEADSKALGRCFPDDQGVRAFDHSSADAALCQHLAFWTGKDCARIDKLFRQSSLMRAKWENRKKYASDTIMKSVNLCRAIYDKKKPEVSSRPSTGVTMKSGLQYCTPEMQLELFKGCAYVMDKHAIVSPGGEIFKPDQFKVFYGGWIFAMDDMNDKTTRNAFEAFTESNVIGHPKVHTLCFRPELEAGSIITQGGLIQYNSYAPVEMKSEPGDVSPFLNHLSKLLPDQNDRNIMLAYMAALVQYKGVKFQWAPLIQGVEGNGKSFMSAVLTGAIGEKYTVEVNPKDIGNKFNAWVENKLLGVIEEIYIREKTEVINSLKPLITNMRVAIQQKGKDQTTGDNRVNFIFNTNHKDAITKTKNDRRYCIFYTAQQDYSDIIRDGMGGGYFPDLYQWLRADGQKFLNHFLLNYDIPDELNPATKCTRAPKTTSYDEAINESLNIEQQLIIEAVESGRHGFCGGWISSFQLTKLFKENLKYPVAPRKYNEILDGIGYKRHPYLANGRTNNAIPSEGGKPILYISENYKIECAFNGSEIASAYLSAQPINGNPFTSKV